MSTANGNPFDSKTVIAIVLVAGIWMAWQGYMEKKYGQVTKAPTPTTAPAQENQPHSGEPAKTVSVEAKKETVSAAGQVSDAGAMVEPEKFFPISTSAMDLKVANRGMAIRDVFLKHYTNRENQPIQMGDGEEAVFEIRDRLTNLPLEFTMTRSEESKFVGVYNKNGLDVEVQLTFRPDHYTFDYQIDVKKMPAGYKGLVVRMIEHVHHDGGGSFLMPAFEYNESLVVTDGSSERTRLVRDESVSKNFEKVSVLGLGSHYFGIAGIDSSDILPSAQVRSHGKLAIGEIEYSPLSSAQAQSIKLRGFMGPKSLDLISSIDERLIPLVNFGSLSWLARPILGLMKGLYSIIQNYGVAIILLTLIVRLLVLPFNVMSFKSMKAMQTIQPQIKALRERYKDDPQQLNLQMMSLMRTNKVNPLGGCLPMLLQLPVFFALYQVLGQSIELYKAPFMLWIHDLSSKDPYYVLPILMGISMFLQQKLTPTTMDPTQAKVMQFLPVVFALMMITLPSGLTLYIFVSTLFGIFQQMVFMRDRRVQAA